MALARARSHQAGSSRITGAKLPAVGGGLASADATNSASGNNGQVALVCVLALSGRGRHNNNNEPRRLSLVCWQTAASPGSSCARRGLGARLSPVRSQGARLALNRRRPAQTQLGAGAPATGGKNSLTADKPGRPIVSRQEAGAIERLAWQRLTKLCVAAKRAAQANWCWAYLVAPCG